MFFCLFFFLNWEWNEEFINLTYQSNTNLQVPPEQFCDIMWAGDLHYKDHQCDFLAAYVAVCYTHQVCIGWRRHNFCRKNTQANKSYTVIFKSVPTSLSLYLLFNWNFLCSQQPQASMCWIGILWQNQHKVGHNSERLFNQIKLWVFRNVESANVSL